MISLLLYKNNATTILQVSSSLIAYPREWVARWCLRTFYQLIISISFTKSNELGLSQLFISNANKNNTIHFDVLMHLYHIIQTENTVSLKCLLKTARFSGIHCEHMNYHIQVLPVQNHGESALKSAHPSSTCAKPWRVST